MATLHEVFSPGLEGPPTDAELALGANRLIEESLGVLSHIPELSRELSSRFLARHDITRSLLPDQLIGFQRGGRRYCIEYTRSVNPNARFHEEKLLLGIMGTKDTAGDWLESVILRLRKREGEGFPFWGLLEHTVLDESGESHTERNNAVAYQRAAEFLEELGSATDSPAQTG